MYQTLESDQKIASSKPNISTGTTLVAVRYKDGVLVGTDSRTSAGSFVANRTSDKITPITDKVVVCRSGSAADTQAIADIVRMHVESLSVMEEEDVSVKRTAEIFKNFCYNYREQLMVSLIIAGYDKRRGGQIYIIPPGGLLLQQDYASSGSGSTFVNGYLDSLWKPDMSFEDTKNLVINAVCLAIHRDGSSGGVIRFAYVNSKGTQRELFKPDAFPKITCKPKSYSMFPVEAPKTIHWKPDDDGNNDIEMENLQTIQKV